MKISKKIHETCAAEPSLQVYIRQIGRSEVKRRPSIKAEYTTRLPLEKTSESKKQENMLQNQLKRKEKAGEGGGGGKDVHEIG
jgi:hypothetical protein